MPKYFNFDLNPANFHRYESRLAAYPDEWREKISKYEYMCMVQEILEEAQYFRLQELEQFINKK